MGIKNQEILIFDSLTISIMKGKNGTMKNIFEIQDLKVLAKKKLPKMFYDYVDSGSFSQSTYRANEEDFKNIKFFQGLIPI